MLAPFTRNKGELQDAVNQVLERAPVSLGPLSSVGVAETDGPPGTPRSPEDRQFAGMRLRLQAGLESPHQQAMQATSLSTLVTMLSRFAGRKSVILFSEGLAVSPRMDWRAFRWRRTRTSPSTPSTPPASARRAASRCPAAISIRRS